MVICGKKWKLKNETDYIKNKNEKNAIFTIFLRTCPKNKIMEYVFSEKSYIKNKLWERFLMIK